MDWLENSRRPALLLTRLVSSSLQDFHDGILFSAPLGLARTAISTRLRRVAALVRDGRAHSSGTRPITAKCASAGRRLWHRIPATGVGGSSRTYVSGSRIGLVDTCDGSRPDENRVLRNPQCDTGS